VEEGKKDGRAQDMDPKLLANMKKILGQDKSNQPKDSKKPK